MPQAAKPHRRPGWRPFVDRRKSAWARGYDDDWKALREKKLIANPLCEHCLKMKPQKWRAAVEVDHIKPFHGKKDSLRMLWSNLQSLCKRHHTMKTNRERQRR